MVEILAEKISGPGISTGGRGVVTDQSDTCIKADGEARELCLGDFNMYPNFNATSLLIYRMSKVRRVRYFKDFQNIFK